MRVLPAFRAAFAAVLAVATAAAQAVAGTTVAHLILDVPATHDRESMALQLERYTLDADTDFSLVRFTASGAPSTAGLVTIVLPAVANTPFGTGRGNRFTLLTLRGTDDAGTTTSRTVLHDVRVVKIEHVASAAGASERVTLSVRRIEAGRVPDPE